MQQSLEVLLTTPKVSRVMRRAVGADLPRRVDSPISAVTVIDFYAAAASAIALYEPRFRVRKMTVDAATPGELAILADGIYFPRGHLGDFTVQEPKNVRMGL